MNNAPRIPSISRNYAVVESRSGRLFVTAYPQFGQNVVRDGFDSADDAMEFARVEYITRRCLTTANGRDLTPYVDAAGWLVVISLVGFCIVRFWFS